MAIREWIAVIFLAGNCSLGIVYVGVETGEVTSPDMRLYLAVYRGDVAANWSFRPLVPSMARLLPDVPSTALSPDRAATDQFQAVVKFGAIDFLCLTGASLALFALQRGFGLGVMGAILGMLSFLTSVTVVRFGGTPLVESAFFLVLSAAFLAIQREKVSAIFLITAIGVFVKELMLLSLVAIWMMPTGTRARMRLTAAMVPGTLLYLGTMVLLRPSTPGYALDMVAGAHWKAFLAGGFGLNTLVGLFLAFGFNWILAGYGFMRGPVPILLRRWVFLVPIVIAGVAMGGGNFMRSTFTVFPVIVPLSAFGLSELLLKGDSAKEPLSGPQKATSRWDVRG